MNPWATLGILPGATPEEIRAAFRRAAAKWHPDRNPGDKDAEAKLLEATKAYEALTSGPESGFGGVPAGAVPDSREDPLQAVASIVGSFVEGLFEKKAAVSAADAPKKGADLRIDLELGPLDAFHGALREVVVAGSAPCGPCSGRGVRDSGSGAPCPGCGGKGMVGLTALLFTIRTTCILCGGKGQASSCPACRGSGLVRSARTIRIEVPGGTKDGSRLRYAGLGEPGRAGAPAGDLLVDIRVV